MSTNCSAVVSRQAILRPDIDPMLALLNLFWEICLLRKGPQDTPRSSELLQLCLIGYGSSGLLALLLDLPRINFGLALLLTLEDVALLSGLAYLGLYLTAHLPRFRQTLTALAGVGTLLQLIALPLGLWYQHALAGNSGAELPAMLWLLLLGWSIAVTGHILRHAFSTTLTLGILYAVGYLVVSWTITNWLLSLAG